MNIIIGSINWALIEALVASGELNRNDLKGASQELLKQIDKNASDRAIDKRIEKLKEDGILHSKKIGKYALYMLNPQADWEYSGVDLRIKKGEKNKHIGENAIARYLLCKDHTDKLKAVVKQWLKEFPIVSTEGVKKWNYPVIGGPEPPFSGSEGGEVNLPVEREDEFIFNDLRFHMDKQTPEIIKSWDEFKKMSLEHNIKGKDLISKIAKEITQHVNSIIPKEAGNIKLEISNELKINSISENFLNFIFNACITWAEDKHNDFMDSYKKFESHTERKDDSVEYWIREGKFVNISNGLLEEETFKNSVDNIINKIVEKSKVDYYREGKEIVNLTKKLISLGDEIKRLLKKQLLYVVFKGDCEYLKS